MFGLVFSLPKDPFPFVFKKKAIFEYILFPSSGAESFFVRALAAVSSDGTDRGRGTELDDVILCNNPLSINLNATGQ